MKIAILLAYISGGILLTILSATLLVIYINHVMKEGLHDFLYELLQVVIILSLLVFYISMWIIFTGCTFLFTAFFIAVMCIGSINT